MNLKSILFIGLILFSLTFRLSAQTEKPIFTDKLIFKKQNSSVAFEAELFYKQSPFKIRQWHITSSGKLSVATTNPDPENIAGSSYDTY